MVGNGAAVLWAAVARVRCTTYAVGMTTLQSTSNPFMHHVCANDDRVSTTHHHKHNRDHHRSRTVPIAATITPVANYPSKLVIYKIPASKYWQMRCFMHGRTHKQSTHTTNQRVALNTARAFYEQLCVQYHAHDIATAAGAARQNVSAHAAAKPQHTFAAMAAQMYAWHSPKSVDI